MRHRWGVLLCVVLAAGCLSDPARVAQSAYWESRKPKPPGAAPDVVEVQYIFIERDVGENAVNETVWQEADEQAIPLDLKLRWNENGFRIAALGDRLPTELQKLLQKSNPTGKGRLQHGRSGHVIKMQMTRLIPDWRFTTVLHDRPQDELVANGQGFLTLVPTIGDDSAVRLALRPEIEHGTRITRFAPAAEYAGWKVQTDRERIEFRDLSIEFDLDSGSYVLVGGRLNRPGTLGHAYFVRPNFDGEDVQAVLLIRVVRPTREELYAAGYDTDDFFLSPLIRGRLSGRSSARETFLMAD